MVLVVIWSVIVVLHLKTSRETSIGPMWYIHVHVYDEYDFPPAVPGLKGNTQRNYLIEDLQT